MATEYTAISVKQPWAGLIAGGQKTIETRTWKTEYRGPLLICSSAARDTEAIAMELLVQHRYKDTGAALAIASLDDCRPMTKADEAAAMCDLYPRAWAWIFGSVQALPTPRRVRGQLGLFKVKL